MFSYILRAVMHRRQDVETMTVAVSISRWGHTVVLGAFSMRLDLVKCTLSHFSLLLLFCRDNSYKKDTSSHSWASMWLIMIYLVIPPSLTATPKRNYESKSTYSFGADSSRCSQPEKCCKEGEMHKLKDTNDVSDNLPASTNVHNHSHWRERDDVRAP